MSESTDAISKVEMINPEQALRCLGVLMQANVPANFVGGPGTGKTTLVRNMIDILNGGEKDINPDDPNFYHLWTAVLSRMEPGDFGIPFTVNGHVEFKIPKFLPFNKQTKGILFLDEWDRSSPEMQNVSLQLMLDRNFHGNTLCNDIFIAMACNGASDTYTTPLSEAARTRCCTLYISAHAAGFAESWMEWADTAGIVPEILAFRKYLSAEIVRHESFEEHSVCNDRTLEFASRIVKAIDEAEFETADIENALLSGVIGKKAAMELINTRRLMKDAPSVEDILKDPNGAKIPENEGVMFGLACRLNAVAKTVDQAQKEKLCVYALRFRKDITASFLTGMLSHSARLINFKPVADWKNANHAILL